MKRQPDPLLHAVLTWTAVTTVVFWLPLIRGPLDGPSYAWGLAPGVGGRGVGGAYPILFLLAAFALGLLYLGWRGARQPFHWLLLLWHLPLGAGATAAGLAAPGTLRFRGDTLGIDISLAWIAPALFGGFALLALVWVLRDLRSGRAPAPPPWTRSSRVLLWSAAGLLPVLFVLLRFGEPDGTTDQLGVLLTLAQWALINLGLYPWQAHETAEERAPAAEGAGP